MKRITWAVALTILMAGETTWGMGRKNPTRVMVALGDSMTAGTFANTTSSPESSKLQDIFLVPPGSSAPASSALERDISPTDTSFKTAFFKFLLKPFLENKDTLSWASGRLISSHYERIRAALQAHGENILGFYPMNLSIPGSKAIHILDQAKKLPLELERRGNPKVDYVAMTMGANDVCDSTAGPVVPDDEFEVNVRHVLAQLAATAEAKGYTRESPLRVMLAGIPRIPNSGAPRFWKHKIFAGLTCETVRRKIFKFCPNLLDWTDEASYLDRMAKVERKNEILKRTILEANEQHDRIQIVFGSGLADVSFEPEDLAFDCFHPNAKAQKRISEALWRDQPWY
jgi:lysophospholipase L1-like esterase